MDKLINMLTQLWSWLQTKFAETSLLKGILFYVVAVIILGLLGFFTEIIGPVLGVLLILFIGYKIYDRYFKNNQTDEETEPVEEPVEEVKTVESGSSEVEKQVAEPNEENSMIREVEVTVDESPDDVND